MIDKNTLLTPGHISGRDKVLGRSRNDERAHIERQDAPNIARTTKVGKHAYDLKVHGGMVSRTSGGDLAYGGDHARHSTVRAAE